MAIDLAWLQGSFPELTNISFLGEGGFKTVFAATHPQDGEIVLKILRPNQDDERVRREILAVQQVQSPRVPRILAEGQVASPVGECVWLREQRINGTTVREILQTSPLDTRQLLRMTLHILEALQKAETMQIVHRDIKPENIMCDGTDFWLLDFGIARHLALESLTPTVAHFGPRTWGYAPPEQCRNMKQDIDSRADLFALGVTVYECATGANPFRSGARDALEILHRVENMQVRQLQLKLTAGSTFSDLIDAMMQKRKDQRPSSAHEALVWVQEECVREQV
jgi:eukaryotic-like serine/threonine-protein kinase